MQDYLKRAKWENRFPQNPTQTHYLRFLETPKKEIKTGFTTSKEDFEKWEQDRLRTIYIENMEKSL